MKLIKKHSNELILFLGVLGLCIFSTIPHFFTAHSLDSYCTMHNGYKETAFWFLNSGRLISFLICILLDFIKFPYSLISFFSILLSNIFLSITIIKSYCTISNDLALTNKTKQVVLLLSLYLIFYNPFMNSLFLFDESFIMCFGIMCIVLGAINLYSDKKYNYVYSAIFIILGIIAYQGIACFLFPFVLIFAISKKENLFFIIKKLLISVLFYGLGFIISLLIIKVYTILGGSANNKVGNIDLIENFILIVKNFIPNLLKYMNNYVNVKQYYMFIIILLLSFILLVFFNREDKLKKSILLLLLIIFIYFSPFIPNLFTSSISNYTATRLVTVICSLPAFIILFITISFDLKKLEKIFLILIALISIYNIYYTNKMSLIDLRRYKKDISYINSISNVISEYEEENKIKIKTIFYKYDNDRAYYYYDLGNGNDLTIRLAAVDWAMECAINCFNNRSIKYKAMKETDYIKYFEGKEYDEFNKEQIKFFEDEVYLLIY